LKKGLLQKDLAKILEIDPTTLSKIERGKGNRVNKAIKERFDNYWRSRLRLAFHALSFFLSVFQFFCLSFCLFPRGGAFLIISFLHWGGLQSL